jgi:hypothetical protein
MATDAGIDIEEINPYEGHPELSSLEGDVLWEYAKLAKNVKAVCCLFKCIDPHHLIVAVFSY